MDISVVVPVYNEAKTVKKNLLAIVSYLKKRGDSFEVLVVNDGSSDRTADIVRDLHEQEKSIQLVSYAQNRGKGYAVKTGVLAATGDAILFLDIDLSTPIEELETFMPLLKKHDIVIGSRALDDSTIEIYQPWYRVVLGKVGNTLIQTIAVRGIKDTQCGFKLFRRKAAHHIFRLMTIDRWGFDFEILYLARKFQYIIKEQGVTWRDERDSKIHLRDYIRTLFELFSIKWNNIRGVYKDR